MEGKKEKNREYLYNIINEFPYNRKVLFSIHKVSIKKIKANIKKMKKEVTEYLIDKYGLSKKTASKISGRALEISKIVSKKLDNIEELKTYAEEQFEKEVEVILSTPYKRDHLTKRKTFFLPSKDGNKHYYIKFVSDKQAALNDEKFSEMALSLLKEVVEKNIESKFDLLHSFFKLSQVDDLISYIAGRLYSDIEVESLKTITNNFKKNNYFFIKDYISSKNNYDSAGLFNVEKKADEEKAKKAAKNIIKHISENSDVEYIIEKELPELVIKTQKKIAEENAKKQKSISKGNEDMISKIANSLYNDFLDKSVLSRQSIEIENKKIKIEDYLKNNQISLIEFIRI